MQRGAFQIVVLRGRFLTAFGMTPYLMKKSWEDRETQDGKSNEELKKKFALLKNVVSLWRRYCCSGFGDSGMTAMSDRFLFIYQFKTVIGSDIYFANVLLFKAYTIEYVTSGIVAPYKTVFYN